MSDLAVGAGALDWVLSKIAAAKKGAAKAPSIPKVQIPGAAEKAEQMKGLRSKEMDLWKQYKKTKKKEDYHKLLDSQLRLMKREVGKFKGVEIDKTTMEVEWMKLHRKAVESFDPSKSQLHTWVTNKTHLNRFVAQRQNVLRPSEPKNALIGAFKTGYTELVANLGREPSLHEVAEHTKLPMKTVVELSRVARGVYDVDAGGEELQGHAPIRLNQMTMAMRIVYPDLTPDEKLIADYMSPRDGRRRVSTTNELAKKTGFDVPKVSKLKTSILSKAKGWLPD